MLILILTLIFLLTGYFLSYHFGAQEDIKPENADQTIPCAKR
jgi:hypothetical protein